MSARRPDPVFPPAVLPAERQPIVLVHGLLMSGRYMLSLAQRLAAWYPVFVPDLPGWGHSGKPPRALSVPELADALVAWLDVVGIQRAILVANSFGCQVVADVAARYPDRVALMVLLGPTVDPEVRSFWRIAGRWLLDVPLEPSSLWFITARDMLDMGLPRFVGSIRAMLADHIEQKLPAIGVPTLVVRGQHDPTVTARWAARAAGLLRCGRMAEIAGAPHAINYNADAVVADLVHAFVDAWQPLAGRAGPPPVEHAPIGRATMGRVTMGRVTMGRANAG